MDIKSLYTKAYDWIDERFKTNALVDYMGGKVVPKHSHSIFYYLRLRG